MATSLAAQLQKLAVPQTSILQRDKKRASLLFDQKEAAGIDRDTFYDIGINGLKELITLNTNFALFEQSLFSVQSKQVERAVERTDINTKLDKNVRKFLMLLSPYFLLKPAHRALEWLIHRFSIHEYNKEDCLKLILPYHETNIFVRFLQILNVRNENDNWHWLRPLQKNGVHLAKLTLFNHAANDVGFLQFISEMTLQAIKDNGSKSNSLTTLFMFYCTTTIGAIDHSSEITEPQITAILPSLLRGLDSNVNDFAAATFVIVTRLLQKCYLSQKMLNQLVSKMTYGKRAHLRYEAVLTAVLLYQLQEDNFKNISTKALNNLLENDWFVSTLGKLAAEGVHVLPLVIPIFKRLLENIEAKKEQVLFENLLKEVHFNDNNIDIVIRSILDNYPSPDDINKISAQWCSDLLKRLENQYPNPFDKVVRDVMSSRGSEKHRQALSSYLNFVMSAGDEKGSMNIFEKLYHPEPKYREIAVNFLVNNYPVLSEKERDIFKGAIQERLLDDNMEVVKSVLTLKRKYLYNMLGHKNYINILIKLLGYCQKRNWLDVVISVINLIYNFSDNVDTRIFLAILPFCLPTNESKLSVARQIMRTEFSKNCQVLLQMKSQVPENVNFKSFIGGIYNCISEETLSNVNILIEELEKAYEKDIMHKYLSVVILTKCLPDNCSAEQSLRILTFVYSYMKNNEISSLEHEVGHPLDIDCIKTARKGKLPLQGMLLCLKTIIEKSENIPLENQWLNLTEPDDSVKFLTQFFTILVNGCSHLKNAKYYSKILKTFCDKFTPNFENKIEFMSNFLIHDFENLHISAIEELRIAKIIKDLIRKSNQSVNWALVLNSKIVVPSILIGLTNPIQEIRTVVLETLTYLANANFKSVDSFTPLLQKLVKRKEELLLDNEQLPLIICNILDNKHKNIVNALFDIASDPEIPKHVTSSLLKTLVFINSPKILDVTSKHAVEILNYLDNQEIIADVHCSYILYNIILRITGNTAGSVKINTSVWEMISLALKQDIVSLEYSKNKTACPSVLVLEQITKEIFNKFNFEVQHSLIKLFSEIVIQVENPEVVSAVNRIIKRINLDAKLVQDGLQMMLDVKSAKIDDNPRKLKTLIPTVDILDMKEWLQGVAILEFIQDKKKMTNSGLLLPILFGILKKCLGFDEQARVEYPKQLILSSILHCCIKMESENVKVNESTFNMGLVVQCVRASQNPQTHHHALLVLAHTASFIPEQVLHNMMAIFTFMGSSVLRHDDAYSFQIISKIIDTIIPILVKVNTTSDKNETEKNVCGVLRVFVDVILDVPEHRRMKLFTKLLNTLGVEQYMWLFLLLIFESYVVHGNEKQKQTKHKVVIPHRLNVATDIMLQYPPAVILKTCIKLIEYLKQLPDEKDDNSMDVESATFNIKSHSPKQFRHYKYTLLTFQAELLQSGLLVNQIAVMNNKETLAMETLYKNLIINILTYIQFVSRTVDRSSGTPQAQYWKAVLHYSQEILDSINALLPKEMFLLVVRGLVVHNIQTVRRKALEILNSKLQHQPQYFYTNSTDLEITETEDLFALLPSLIEIIKTIQKDVESEQELLQQTALLSLKLLVKLLAENNKDKFTPILDFMTDLIKSDKAQGNILASIVLCLGELVGYLRANSIPALVKFMPAILKVLKKQKQQQTPTILLNCTITAIQRIVEVLPLFLSPYLEKLLFEISVLSCKWENDENNKIGPFLSKLKTIRSNIGNTIPSRILIPVIGETYESLLKHKNYNAIGSLLNVLSENLTNVRGQELNNLLPELTNFFLNALQFRTENSELDLSDINTVEDHVINALTILVLKLSETTFRPFYYRLYDWAVRSDTKNERIITFYRLSFGIAESLKGLFILFAGHIIKNAASILDECNTFKSENLYFKNKQKCIILTENVLRTLKTVFTYNSQNFIDKDRFETLMQPLVNQLENKIDGLANLSKRANDLLIPTIAQFAISTGDDTMWKHLNYQILLKTRHDIPAVRLIGLNCVFAVAQKIGEDFLPLLPETIPFLAELLEDEDETVESSCQKVVQELEKVLGEPLQKYF